MDLWMDGLYLYCMAWCSGVAHGNCKWERYVKLHIPLVSRRVLICSQLFPKGKCGKTVSSIHTLLAILLSHPITDCQSWHAYTVPHTQQIPPLLALSVILHESILTPQFLKLLLSILLGGIADVGVGEGSLR